MATVLGIDGWVWVCFLLCVKHLPRVSGKARYLSMVAGGSGITPCYDVAREVLHDPSDNTRISLVYANKHEEDIWLRKVGTEAAED